MSSLSESSSLMKYHIPKNLIEEMAETSHLIHCQAYPYKILKITLIIERYTKIEQKTTTKVCETYSKTFSNILQLSNFPHLETYLPPAETNERVSGKQPFKINVSDFEALVIILRLSTNFNDKCFVKTKVYGSGQLSH